MLFVWEVANPHLREATPMLEEVAQRLHPLFECWPLTWNIKDYGIEHGLSMFHIDNHINTMMMLFEEPPRNNH
jgi:hypothetical protein